MRVTIIIIIILKVANNLILTFNLKLILNNLIIYLSQQLFYILIQIQIDQILLPKPLNLLRQLIKFLILRLLMQMTSISLKIKFITRLIQLSSPTILLFNNFIISLLKLLLFTLYFAIRNHLL